MVPAIGRRVGREAAVPIVGRRVERGAVVPIVSRRIEVKRIGLLLKVKNIEANIIQFGRVAESGSQKTGGYY